MALTVGELVAFLRLDKSQYDRGLTEAKLRAHADADKIGDSLAKGLGGKITTALGTAGRLGGIALAAGLSAGLGVQGIANVVAALAPLTGLLVALPAVAGAAGVALGTVKLGLSGVGAALKAGLAGDTEKFNKALEGMAPAARAAVREIVALKPAFDKVKQSVQEELFTGISEQVKALGSVYLPVLQSGLPKVAASLSVFAENFSAAAKSGPLLDGVRAIIDSTARGLAHANDNVGGLTRAFGSLLSVGAPLVERLGSGFATVSGYFADFIQRAAQSGELNAFLQGALDTLRTLGGLVLNVGKILGSVFQAANTQGSGLFRTLEDLTGQFAAFLRSAEGSSALKSIFAAVSAFGAALRTALGAVLPALAAALAAIGPQIGPLADALAQVVVALAPLLPAAGQLAAAIMPQLAQTITDLVPLITALVSGFSALAGFLSDNIGIVLPLVAAIGAMVGYVKLVTLAVRAWFVAQLLLDAALDANPIGVIVLAIVGLVAALVYAYTHSEKFRAVVQATWAGIKAAVGAVIGFFAGLPAFFAGIWGIITGAFNSATLAIANAILAVVNFFVALPGRILSALVALPGVLLRLWLDALNAVLFAVGFALGTVVRFFMDLPGRVMRALAALPGLLSGLWNAAMVRAKAIVDAGLAAVVSFFRSLPGRAAKAASSLWSAISGAFSRAAANAAVAARQLVDGVLSWLRGLPGKAAAAIQSVPGKIKGVFSGASGWLVQAGKDVLAGLASGIKSAVGAVVDQAKRAASSIVSGFKSAMGIGSPSRVMADEVGRWIPPGIAQGIRDATPQLNRDVAKLLDGLPTDVATPGVAMPTGGRAPRAAGAAEADLAAQLARLADAQARAELAGVPEVRVFIGDQELTDMIDTRVGVHSRATTGAAYAGSGRRAG